MLIALLTDRLLHNLHVCNEITLFGRDHINLGRLRSIFRA
jgi:hypothetical protein